MNNLAICPYCNRDVTRDEVDSLPRYESSHTFIYQGREETVTGLYLDCPYCGNQVGFSLTIYPRYRWSLVKPTGK